MVVVDCGGWGRLSVGIGKPRLVGWIVYRVRKAVVVLPGGKGVEAEGGGRENLAGAGLAVRRSEAVVSFGCASAM